MCDWDVEANCLLRYLNRYPRETIVGLADFDLAFSVISNGAQIISTRHQCARDADGPRRLHGGFGANTRYPDCSNARISGGDGAIA